MSEIADLLMDLVRIDSESGEEEEFLLYLSGLLSRRFAASCERDAFGNLIARIPPIQSVRSDPVLFGVHADTVAPGRSIKPVLEDGVVRSSGDTILGSDDKAGIAELITALDRTRSRPPIEILVTREEEVGLRGAKHAELDRLHARMAFVLDGADVHRIIIGGPSLITMDITIHGRAAHAGMRPEEGISALQVAAMAMVNLPLGRVDSETTCNVGKLTGGSARNAIPTTAQVLAECRSLSHEKCDQLASRFERAFKEAASSLGASVVISRELLYRACSIPETADVVRVAVKALRAVGLEPSVEPITGGTDALVLANRGLPAVVLGMGNCKSHTVDEHISVESLELAAGMLEELLGILATEQESS